MIVSYSCPDCGLVDVDVEVRFRESQEDVVAWVRDVVAIAMYLDHRGRSTACTAESGDVKIPFEAGAEFVGRPVLH